MTRDDIIRMAREAGLHVDDSLGIPFALVNEMSFFRFNKVLEDFARAAYAAGAAAEREAIIPLIYGYCDSDNAAQRTVDAIRARGADDPDA